MKLDICSITYQKIYSNNHYNLILEDEEKHQNENEHSHSHSELEGIDKTIGFSLVLGMFYHCHR